MIERQTAISFIRLALIMIGVAGLVGCEGEREQQPMIDITLDRDNDSSADVVVDETRAFIDVTDPRGINGLTARLESGQWPEEVVVFLRLRGLEHLEIRYGDFTITTGRSSNSSPDPPLMLSVIDEQGQVQSASPSATIYYPAIRKTADGFEIELPPHFFGDDYDSFSVQWIDFYR